MALIYTFTPTPLNTIAPDSIQEFMFDILMHSIKKEKNFPIHIPAMGGRGGHGCNILDMDYKKGEITIIYNLPGHSSFILDQAKYDQIRKYFNSLKGTPKQFQVGTYATGAIAGVLGIVNTPHIPAIFKEIGYKE